MEGISRAAIPTALISRWAFLLRWSSRLKAVRITGDEGDDSGQIVLYNREGSNNFAGVTMDARDSIGTGGEILVAASNGTTTIESKTNFVGAAETGARLLATSTPVHRGRRSQVWQTRIETEDGKLVALTTQTQLTL